MYIYLKSSSYSSCLKRILKSGILRFFRVSNMFRQSLCKTADLSFSSRTLPRTNFTWSGPTGKILMTLQGRTLSCLRWDQIILHGALPFLVLAISNMRSDSFNSCRINWILGAGRHKRTAVIDIYPGEGTSDTEWFKLRPFTCYVGQVNLIELIEFAVLWWSWSSRGWSWWRRRRCWAASLTGDYPRGRGGAELPAAAVQDWGRHGGVPGRECSRTNLTVQVHAHRARRRRPESFSADLSSRQEKVTEIIKLNPSSVGVGCRIQGFQNR